MTSEHPTADTDAWPLLNIVWTGDVFRYLQFFCASLIAQTDARFRFVANACTRPSIELMEAFASRHADRVTGIVVVSDREMLTHGASLDAVLTTFDDGPYFGFIDADIKARGPFLADLVALLDDHAAVTSGKEVWTDDNVVPDDHIGVGLGGRHFYHPGGFVYGSPHLGLYRRNELLATMDRWDVGLGSVGSDLADATRDRIDELGHLYKAYDTAKVVNILLQADGGRLTHREHDALVHIGGLSHYLAPPDWDKRTGKDGEPTWTTMRGMTPRTEVARYCAALLRDLAQGRPAPDPPVGLDPAMRARLDLVRHEIVDLVACYSEMVVLGGRSETSGTPR